MKRCPECRRDYFDDTLLYCLEDGTALVQGSVPSPDEPQTAILSETGAEATGSHDAEAQTRPHIPTTDQTAILRTGIEAEPQESLGGLSEKQSSSTNRAPEPLAALMVAAVILVGGFFGYRYFKPATSEQINSIAVLPFENRSGNADTDYLSDGLADSLIYRLSQLPNLKVSPTSSVMRYRGKETDVAQIATELKVDAVMFGRLVQRGDDLSISVQLIDSRTEKVIWAEQYDRKMADLLATQREIATTITQKLQLKLAGDERGITKKYTDSNEAYQLYLKGRYYFARRTKDEVIKAIQSYEQAIELDPNFALAYARIAEAYNQMPAYPYSPPQEAFPKAKAAAKRALEIDPNLSEAHTALGNTLAAYDWNWAEAEREFRRAIELDPKSATAHFRYGQLYLGSSGRVPEAIAEMDRGLDSEPLDINMVATKAWWMAAIGQRDQAFALAKNGLDLDPNHPVARNVLAQIYIFRGQSAEALTFIEQNRQPPANRQWELQGLGVAYAKLGRREDAAKVIDEFKALSKTQYVMSYYVAAIYASLGDRENAFAELAKAVDARDWRLMWLKSDPFFDSIRDDPRYAGLLKRMGLPE
jgi:TolB-like protein/Flp pilus assembly protein TadD